MKKYSNDKDINRLVVSYTKAGWSIGKGKKHQKLISPDGFKFTIPSTPSDRRALYNFRRDLQVLSQNKEC